jgi:hypothetical protein
MLKYAVRSRSKSDSDNIKLEVGEPMWCLAILVNTKRSETMDGSQRCKVKVVTSPGSGPVRQEFPCRNAKSIATTSRLC